MNVTQNLSYCARGESVDLEDRAVEKLVTDGINVVALNVDATLCRHCGER